MNLDPIRKFFTAKRTPLPAGDDAYSRLIVENLPYIEKQCRRALACGAGMDRVHAGGAHAGPGYHGGSSPDNEADELLNEVLDRLKADNFKALREFRGGAKLTTYITTIIANLVVDLVRQKKGRSRARERAEEMGGVARTLYDLVYGRGCSVHEAQGHLEVAYGILEPLEGLQQMLDRMRGRERATVWGGNGGSAWLAPGQEVSGDDATEIIVADPAGNSEDLLINGQRSAAAKRTLDELLGELSGEDRLMMRLRFPEDEDEEPRSAREIAAILGLSEKAVDARIRRILVRMREILIGRGLSLEDFIAV